MRLMMAVREYHDTFSERQTFKPVKNDPDRAALIIFNVLDVSPLQVVSAWGRGAVDDYWVDLPEEYVATHLNDAQIVDITVPNVGHVSAYVPEVGIYE